MFISPAANPFNSGPLLPLAQGIWEQDDVRNVLSIPVRRHQRRPVLLCIRLPVYLYGLAAIPLQVNGQGAQNAEAQCPENCACTAMENYPAFWNGQYVNILYPSHAGLILSSLERQDLPFLRREALCRTLQQRRVELLTITAPEDEPGSWPLQDRKWVFMSAR